MMLFREPNRVKWVGVRPGHDGTQVIKSGTATNQTTILHTVTATKTFFLTGAWVSGRSNDSYQVTLLIRNALDVLVYNIFNGNVVAGVKTVDFFKSFPFPIEVDAEYDVCIFSGKAACVVDGGVEGWEQ